MTRHVVPAGTVPLKPVAAGSVLPRGPELVLHIEHPELYCAVVSLRRGEFINLPGIIRLGPTGAHPIAPNATGGFLVGGVKAASMIDSPKLRPKTTALLAGCEFG